MVYLRKATTEDMDLLFVWANDKTLRANSFSSEQIPYEDHVNWFMRTMKSETIDIYILIDDGIPVGQIRLDISGEDAEISYGISAPYRGKGYGKLILQKFYDLVKSEYPDIKRLIARVKPDNNASKKILEREGYTMKYVCYNMELLSTLRNS